MFTELKQTVRFMNSEDYKKRFIAEYWQLKIRYEKLDKLVFLWDQERLTFTPTCPRSWYDVQLKAMSDYLQILQKRAAKEGINLADTRRVQNAKSKTN